MVLKFCTVIELDKIFLKFLKIKTASNAGDINLKVDVDKASIVFSFKECLDNGLDIELLEISI